MSLFDVERCTEAATSDAPGLLLEHGLEWRVGDAAGVVGDGRSGTRRQHFQRLLRFEARGLKRRDRLVAEVAPPLNESPCEGGEGGVNLDLPRFRGEVRSWDQGTWFDCIVSSSLGQSFGSAESIFSSRPAGFQGCRVERRRERANRPRQGRVDIKGIPLPAPFPQIVLPRKTV